MRRAILLFSAIVFLSFNSVAQFNLSWVNSVSGTWNQIGYHVTTDATGNIYTVGTFSDTSDLDPTAGSQTVTPEGRDDIYVVKQSSNGSLIWAKSFGGSNMDSPAGIGVDNSGNVYISGTFDGDIDLDPSASTYSFFTGSTEVFVLKLNSLGNFVWGASMGSGASDNATSMCIDALGNVYTAGTFEGMMDFDPGAGTYNINPFGSFGTDIFISKLDANGDFVWAVSMGGTSSEKPNSICVDALFNVYTTGDFQGVADFDPSAGSYTLSSIDQDDAYVSKLDGSGGFVWAKQFGGMDYQNGASITLDANNIYIAGYFATTVDFDPGVGTYTIANAPFGASPYAVKLSHAGNFVWAKAILAIPGAPQISKSIRVGSDGSVYWTTGLNNSSLQVLDGSGNTIKSVSFTYVWESFVVNSSAEIIATGWFYYGDFDPSTSTFTLNSTGATDACVVKLNQLLPDNVSEANSENTFTSIYPNPNNGSFTIHAPIGAAVKVVNVLGQEVYSLKITDTAVELNLNECKNGIYFLMMNNNGKQSCQKFVIAH